MARPITRSNAALTGWIADTAADPGDRLVISHGNSSRVLRGMMAGPARRIR